MTPADLRVLLGMGADLNRYILATYLPLLLVPAVEFSNESITIPATATYGIHSVGGKGVSSRCIAKVVFTVN